MRLPNFIIIGAHKAGTTSLYVYLKSHPQIFMPELKEARYFAFDPKNPDHIKKVPKIFPISTLKEYSALFDNVNDEVVYGEASPEYLNSEYAADKIYRHIPNARLIVSLRNPVDRAYSHFLMNHRAGDIKNIRVQDYKLSYDDARKGYYYPKLKKYYDTFNREQIKVILFDDLVEDTTRTVQDIFSFLGVSESFSPNVSTIYNRGGVPKFKLIHKISNNEKLKRVIRTYFPFEIVSTLKNIKDKNLKKSPQLTRDQRIESIKLVKEDILKVEKLIQRDLSAWYEI